MLIASGVNVESGERSGEFGRLLNEAHAEYDPTSGTIRTSWLQGTEIAGAALRFTALLIRVFELRMLHPEKVASTFREDVIAAIRDRFEGRVEIDIDAPVAPELAEFVADVVLTSPDSEPVAIFIATGDTRIYEAVMMRTIARYRLQKKVRVAAVLESERPKGVSVKAQQRAHNYLDASPSFSGDQAGAMTRIEEMLIGSPPAPMH